MFQLRSVLTAAPAFYLLVAWGVVQAPRRWLNGLLLLPTLVMMTISLANLYFNPVFDKPPWREAAYYVRERTRPGDVVLHTGDGSFLPFLVYGPTAEQVLLPLDPDAVAQNAPSQPIVRAVGGVPTPMEQAVQGYDRAWLVVGLDQAVDYQLGQKERFDTRYRRLAEEQIGGVYIFTYALD